MRPARGGTETPGSGRVDLTNTTITAGQGAEGSARGWTGTPGSGGRGRQTEETPGRRFLANSRTRLNDRRSANTEDDIILFRRNWLWNYSNTAITALGQHSTEMGILPTIPLNYWGFELCESFGNSRQGMFGCLFQLRGDDQRLNSFNPNGKNSLPVWTLGARQCPCPRTAPQPVRLQQTNQFTCVLTARTPCPTGEFMSEDKDPD